MFLLLASLQHKHKVRAGSSSGNEWRLQLCPAMPAAGSWSSAGHTAGLSKGLGSWSLHLSFLAIFFFVLTESETRFTVWKYSCTKVPEFLSWQLHKISSGSVSGRPLSCQRLLQVEGNLSSYCKTKFLICYTDLAHSTQQLTTTSKKIKNISFLKSQQIKKKHLRVVHITSSSYARDFSVLQD